MNVAALIFCVCLVAGYLYLWFVADPRAAERAEREWRERTE